MLGARAKWLPANREWFRARLHGFGVAGDSLEGESPGEIRFMSSELEPGRCGLLRNPSFGQDEKRGIRGLMRKPQDASFDGPSPESWSAILSRLARQRFRNAHEDDTARVAGPGRICIRRLPLRSLLSCALPQELDQF